MKPRGILAVYAMARPARPLSERSAVIEASGSLAGTASARAVRLAKAVASAALADIDMDADDRLLALLRPARDSPVRRLAVDPEINTAEMIIAERIRRMRARAGARLPEREWPSEDRDVLTAVIMTLARRYRRYLAE